MNDEMKLLCAEIEVEHENLAEAEFGSEEYKVGVEGLTKLYDRAIEIKKLDAEKEKRAEEAQFRNKQQKDENKHRIIGHILTGAGILIPTMVAIWGTKTSLKFEETGSVTTIFGRGWINKLLPKK